MGAKKFSHTHRSTMCGLKKLASGVFPEIDKCRQNGGGRNSGGGNGPKTTSPPVTWGDLIIMDPAGIKLTTFRLRQGCFFFPSKTCFFMEETG